MFATQPFPKRRQIDVARQRGYFWDAIGKKLDKLGKRITPKDRKKIEATIALKVPRRARRKKII